MSYSPVVAIPDPLITIASLSGASLGAYVLSGGVASATYTGANKAVYIPFRLTTGMTALSMYSYNGTVASGNIDLGIYDALGNKLVSAGSTAQSGTSVLQKISIASTYLPPGLYYMAVAMDNATGTLFKNAPSQSAFCAFMGMAQQATAFPLPSTATFASMTSGVFNYIPCIGLTGRSVL